MRSPGISAEELIIKDFNVTLGHGAIAVLAEADGHSKKPFQEREKVETHKPAARDVQCMLLKQVNAI